MTGHSPLVAHGDSAGRDTSDESVGGHRRTGTQTSNAADALVLIAADVLDDLERTRIATENRLRSLTHEPVEGERGGWFGKGLSPDMAEVRQVERVLEGLRQLEHAAELDLKRAMRKHPLGAWVKRTVGVGEKQAARLLAAIGDPGERRTVSQLWAYCGYHVLHPGQLAADAQMDGTGVDPTDHSGPDTRTASVGGESLGDHPDQGWHDTHGTPVGVAPKRRKGTKANWSNVAKMRARLIAEACVKAGIRKNPDAGPEFTLDTRTATTPYGAKYMARRARTAVTHPEWTSLHQHNDALRIVAKEVLKDLWREARHLTGYDVPDTHLPRAGEAGGKPDEALALLSEMRRRIHAGEPLGREVDLDELRQKWGAA